MRNLLYQVNQIILLLTLSAAVGQAQQPFYTDDTDVTPQGRWHFEFSNESHLLSRSAYPSLKQNTSAVEIGYGVLRGMEVSLEAPLIYLFNARGVSPRSSFGVGDARIAVKWNLIREEPETSRPALSVSFATELPTGKVEQGLGSGKFDYELLGIVQKSLTRKVTMRMNAGFVSVGTPADTSLVPASVPASRDQVYKGGISLTRDFTHRLRLGAEVIGAGCRNNALGRAQLQGQVGGNYRIREGLTFDFGLSSGRFSASPRLGLQVGFSFDP